MAHSSLSVGISRLVTTKVFLNLEPDFAVEVAWVMEQLYQRGNSNTEQRQLTAEVPEEPRPNLI